VLFRSISSSTEGYEIVEMVKETEIKDNLREVSESTLSSIILSNAAQLRKVTLVYLYEGDEADVPLAFKSMSTNPAFEDKVDFLALKNPTHMTIQQFNVPRLPVIIGGLPPPENMPETPETQGQIQTMVYTGNVEDYFELIDYNMNILNMFFPKTDEDKQQETKRSEKTIDFEEITSENFEEICEDRKGLCVIAFLDGLQDDDYSAARHVEHLAMLEQRNEESSGTFKYMWINATCHSYLLPKFELSQMFLPTVVIYSPSQQKYSRMVTTLEMENLIEFEKAFEGTGKGRIIVNDAPDGFAELIQELDCPNIMPDWDTTADSADSDLDDEIMREILEEERKKREELGLEDDATKKKKKKSKGKKKNKKK
jgi:hypothetical protein